MPNSDIIACSPRSDLVHCLLHRAHAAPRKGLWFSTWLEAENLQQTMGLYGFIMVYMGLMDWFQNVEGKHMDKLYTKPWLLPLIAEVSDFLVSCSHHTILGSIGLRENMQQNHILLQQTPFLSCRFSMIFPSTHSGNSGCIPLGGVNYLDQSWSLRRFFKTQMDNCHILNTYNGNHQQ